MDVDGLRARAVQVLRGNDTGEFIKPGPRQYPHQWNWDAALNALGLAHLDLPRALREIRALLRGQWRDGMVPHILYHSGPSDYFPDPEFWRIRGSPDAPAMSTSGLTQPPVLATVVRRIHQRVPVPDFVREVYPALLRWHRWLHTVRDADGTALACIIHPWESGTDDSPRWLRALEKVEPGELPAYRRRDTVHVPAPERPSDADYQRFVHLIDLFRRHRYRPGALLEHSPFLVQDLLVNTVLFRADQDLRALAVEIGEPVDEIDGWLLRVRQHFDERFWNEDRALYFDYDLRAGAPIAVNTAATFMPLYAGLASQAQAHRLVAEHWLDAGEYAKDPLTRFWVTSTSKAEPAWDARRYWRGPVWVVLNWFLVDGLRRYGYAELAEEVRRDSLALVSHHGFWEYYDPRDGSGCGSPDFSWPAALTLDFLADDHD
jgi:glycogen debranching enzyme